MKDKQEHKTIKINLDRETLPAGLYLVGTPIGYLKDISIRALETFMSVDVVACEDTRVTGKLLHHYGIQAKKIKYNDHSDARVREEIFERISQGQSVALCSDAGLPLIADPGYKLVRECVERGIYVTSVPGANAALTGLQLSGLATDQFMFLGFIPNKLKAREDYLSRWVDVPMTQVYYESAVRVTDTLEALKVIMGDRQIIIARELTKRFEELLYGSCSDLLQQLSENPIKGEVVLVVAPNDEDHEWDEVAVISRLSHLMLQEERSAKDAVKVVMSESGWPKKDVYRLALEVKDGR